MNKIFKLSAKDLPQLFTAVTNKGYTVIAPVYRDGTIVYDRVQSSDELAVGWTDQQSPSTYRLSKDTKGRYFGFHIAPQSWKRFLYPPKRNLFRARKNAKSIDLLEGENGQVKYAFIGVRPCELNAILIQDLVFNSDQYGDADYMLRRRDLLIVAVNCIDAAEDCFCSSMKTGPKAKEGFDIALTEVVAKGEHYFIAEAGSETGESIINQTNSPDATDQEINDATKLIRHAESKMKKSLDTSNLQQLLSNNMEHQHWDNIAKRCLTCGNCTMVCPTCFCSTVEDVTDLSGVESQRLREWDSCFTMDFSKVAGGSFRITSKSRYRQWLTHKFSSWVEQFGVFGCVGCGRCITWCPVGIDITSEINSIRGT